MNSTSTPLWGFWRASRGWEGFMWPRLALNLRWRREWSWTSEVLVSSPCPQSTGVTGMSPHDVLLLKSMATLTVAFRGWFPPSFYLTVFQTFYFYAILFFLVLCNLVIVCFLVSLFSPSPPISSLNDLRLLSDLCLWICNFYPILKILQYHFLKVSSVPLLFHLMELNHKAFYCVSQLFHSLMPCSFSRLFFLFEFHLK